MEETALFRSLSVIYRLKVPKAPLKASSFSPLQYAAADKPVELRDRYPEHPIAAPGRRQVHRPQLARIYQVRDMHHAHAQQSGGLLALEQDRFLRLLLRIFPGFGFP